MMFQRVSLLFVVIFMATQAERLKVAGPKDPVVAVAGEDLVLPCFIKPSASAVDMRVEWFRLDAEHSLVHLYKDQKDSNEKQAQSYKGRASLFKEELQKGNTSLKLSAVRLSDEGEYKCFVEDKSWYDDIIVYVIVKILGSHPVIMMESFDNSGGINLVCESRGWNPEPDVLWLDREGVTLTAEDTQIHRDTELFNVKSRISVYDYSDSNRFYCRLQQKHHMMETDIVINSGVFGVWKWAVSISVVTFLFLVGLILTGVFRHKTASELQQEKQYAELLKKKMFRVDVTLDPDSAHPQLILSDDRKKVTRGDTRQNLPDSPQRLKFLGVLGKQSFSSGRFYYEVQVRGKTEWTLGIVKENINRERWITWSPQNGFWTVGLRNEYQCSAYDIPPVPFTLKEKMEVVGVFVDYKEGLVSFYNVKSRSHIYSFTGQTFTEKLYTYFSPRYKEDGRNSAPLIISDVTE